MQYLLSEEEMAVIRDERMAISSKLRGDVRSHVEALTNLCKHVATTMIQTQAVNGGGVSDRPHGCPHVPDPRGSGWQTHYCDNCQVAGLCPLPKEYSK